MKIAYAAIAVICFASFPPSVCADAFFTKGTGSALDLAVWKAVRNGTITMEVGSQTVVGTGTEFTKIYFPAPGYAKITSADGATVLGTVFAIIDDTHLTLALPADAAYTDIPFTMESLPTINDDITINAGHAINANLGAGQAFGIHNIVIDGALSVDADFFNITGDLTINDGATLTTTPTTRIVFDGTSTIGGTKTPIVLDYFRVKGSAAVTLAVPLIVNHLEMEGGTINTGSASLTLGASAESPGLFSLTGPGGGVTGLIVGTFTRWIGAGSIAMGELWGYFPMGAGTNFRKAWIAKSHAGTGTITVTHTDGSGTTSFGAPFTENALIFDKHHNMSWTIAAGNGYTGATDLRLQESGLDPVQMPPANLTACLAGGAAGGTYAPASIVNGDTVVNRTDIGEADLSNTFSIAIGSTGELPVELMSFAASVKDDMVLLRWNTATEKNNYGFDVERSPIMSGTRHWTKIGFAQGAGTTNAPQAYTYADRAPAGVYAYRLKQIDRDGRFEYSREIETAVMLKSGGYELTQNYPNPFNPATTIRFVVAASNHAVLKVYNALGQEVRTLFDGAAEANMVHTVIFDARDLPSGLYYYTLRSGGRTEVKKMQLVK